MNLNRQRKELISFEGLLVALDNIDDVIKLIRNSKTPDEAKTGLVRILN